MEAESNKPKRENITNFNPTASSIVDRKIYLKKLKQRCKMSPLSLGAKARSIESATDIPKSTVEKKTRNLATRVFSRKLTIVLSGQNGKDKVRQALKLKISYLA